MTKKPECHVFTSESVSEGHPDKVADQISDAILDACLRADPKAHVACETMVGPDVVINMGEVTCRGWSRIDPEAIARRVAKKIGYDADGEHFSAKTFSYQSFLHEQSPDIARGVNRKVAKKQGAGDQGMMFGYATDETPGLMPATLVYAHEILKMYARLRHRGGKYAWLRPDAKCQLSIAYEDGVPHHVETVVVSHQMTEAGSTKLNEAELERLAKDYLSKTGLLKPRTRFLINPTGKFVLGGPGADSGLTGRKIIVDTYGGVAAHGGGSFSGKDPSKVDRSAAYYARYAAKNIVAAGLAKRCQIQVSYAIGVDEPVSFCVNTFGTAKDGVTDQALAAMLHAGKVFDFKPYSIISELGLLKPRGWTYEETAAYGHFGREIFPWERTDRVAKLRKVF